MRCMCERAAPHDPRDVRRRSLGKSLPSELDIDHLRSKLSELAVDMGEILERLFNCRTISTQCMNLSEQGEASPSIAERSDPT
jgi:hypothetical protein